MPPIPNEANRTITHPIYAAWAATWRTALDVYEGSGGFLDAERPYLMPHPREWLDHSIKSSDGLGVVPNPRPSQPSPKLVLRRKLARYENLAETVLEAVASALFAEPATRTVGNDTSTTAPTTLEQWWQDVDGKGTDIQTALHDAWTVAAVFGHAVLLLDQPATEATTAADAGLPRLCRYTPLDVIDWLTDSVTGDLVAVKLVEPAPRLAFDRPGPDDYRVRVVDAEGWRLYDKAGVLIDQADHGFGRLPVAVLYAVRRPMTPVVGKSLLGDPMLFIDAYNLTSEVRELLRNQTFAILNVPIGPDGSVEVEQARLGQQSGTSNVMFSGQPAQYVSPGGENVQAYHEHLDRLGRMIYRLVSVPWDGDSRGVEAAESRRLKRGELVAKLGKFAGELIRAEQALVDLVYRAQYGSRWEAQRDADEVTIRYPKTFEPPDLEVVATYAAAAIGLDLGETATKELKKHTARVFLPHAAAQTIAAIDDEIDGQTILSADEQRQAMVDAAASRVASTPRMAEDAMTEDDGREPPTVA